MRIGKLGMVLGVVAATVGLFGSTAVTFASILLNVDINNGTTGSATYTGLAVATDPAGATANWNGINGNAIADDWGYFLPTPVTSTGLVDSLGNASPDTITWHGYYTAYDYTAATGFDIPTAIATNLLSDGASSETVADAEAAIGLGFTNVQLPPSQFTINNLNPAKTYDLYLYGAPGSAVDGSDHNIFPVTFTVNGVNQDTGANPEHLTGGQVDQFTLGGNYVLYSGLTPALDGTITVGFATSPGASAGLFDGFQLVETPEPASLSLLAIGGLLMLKRRRAA